MAGKILVARKLNDGVLQERCVDVEAPLQVPVADNINAELQLPSPVFHRTDVLHHCDYVSIETGVTGRRCLTYLVEQVYIALVVVADAEVEAVIEQRSFQSNVKRVGRLPFQVVSRKLVGEHNAGATVCGKTVQVPRSIIPGCEVVTYSTVSSTQFQVVDPINVLHEFFLGNHPACSDAPECTPSVLLAETARTVTADGSLGKVFLVVVVANAAQIGLGAQTGHGIRCNVGAFEVANVGHVVHQLLAHTQVTVVVHELIVLMIQKYVDVVQTVIMIPAQLLHKGIGTLLQRLDVHTTDVLLRADDVVAIVLTVLFLSPHRSA